MEHSITSDSGDIHAAEYYLAQLRPLRPSCEPEMVFEINLLEIELLIKRKELDRAYTKVDTQLAKMKEAETGA